MLSALHLSLSLSLSFSHTFPLLLISMTTDLSFFLLFMWFRDDNKNYYIPPTQSLLFYLFIIYSVLCAEFEVYYIFVLFCSILFISSRSSGVNHQLPHHHSSFDWHFCFGFFALVQIICFISIVFFCGFFGAIITISLKKRCIRLFQRWLVGSSVVVGLCGFKIWASVTHVWWRHIFLNNDVNHNQ